MKWRYIVLLFVLLSSLLVLIFGVRYANAEAGELRCTSLDIKILDSAELAFVTTSRVSHFLHDNYPDLVGKHLLEINTAELESALKSMSGVEEAQVYYGVDGLLRVDLKQRKPLFRIVARTEESCYVDHEGYTFPVDHNYAAHVPVVTGNIRKPDGGLLRLSDSAFTGLIPPKDSISLCKEKNWGDLFELLLFLESDSFWRSQFAQVYVDSWSRIELIPRVGSQLIVLGSMDNYRYKLNKLYSFYNSLLTDERSEQYAVIDLQYSNQVVCQRR